MTTNTAIATGSSTANGTWSQNHPPLTSEDVVIPNTFTVTVPTATTMLGRSLNVQNGGGLTWTDVTSLVNIGDSAGGDVTFGSTSTLTFTAGSGQGFLTMVSTVSGTVTLTTNGKILPIFSVSLGSSTTFSLGDAYANSAALVQYQSGAAFNTNNFSMAFNRFSSVNPGVTRALNLGSSTLTMTETSGVTWTVGTIALGLTINAGTSTLAFTGTATAVHDMGGQTYYDVTITGTNAFYITGTNTFHNLTRTGTAAKVDGLLLGADQIVNGALSLNGNSAINNILVSSDVQGTKRTITCNGTIAATSFVHFADITIAGTAAPLTGTLLGDVRDGASSSNSGITFPAGITERWLGNYGLTGSKMTLPGTVQNYAGTGDTAALSITGDIEIIACINATLWIPAANWYIVSKSRLTANAQQSYALRLSTTGKLVGIFSTTGSNAITATSTVATGFTDGTTHWVRMTRTSVAGVVTFYTSNDASTTAPGSVTWTPLGTAITTTAGSMFDGTEPLAIGCDSVGLSPFTGDIYKVEVNNGIAGTVAFNADFTAPSAHAQTFNESSTNNAVVSVYQGVGNWSDVTKWTTRMPLPQDDVVVNQKLSISATIGGDMQRLGKNIDFTGMSGAGSPAAALTWSRGSGITPVWYGSLTLASGMASMGVLSPAGTWSPAGRSASYTITTAGVPVEGLNFNGFGSTYTLQDAVSCASTSTSAFVVSAGAVTTAFTITMTGVGGRFSVSQGASFTSTSTIALANQTSTPVSLGTLATISMSSATISFATKATAVRTIQLGAINGCRIGTVSHMLADDPFAVNIGTSGVRAAITNLNWAPGGRCQVVAGSTLAVTNYNHVGVANGYEALVQGTTDTISTPDSVALSITGDIDLRVRLALDDWTPTATSRAIMKRDLLSTGGDSYSMSITTAGLIQMTLSQDGSAVVAASSSVAPTIADGATLWIRATWRASDGRVQFFTASGAIANTVVGDYTQLGSNQTIALASIADTTTPVTVGMASGANAITSMIGRMYRAQIRNGLDGTLVFDADFVNKAILANTFDDSSGTINPGTGLPPVITLAGATVQVGDGRAMLTSGNSGSQGTFIIEAGGTWTVDYIAIRDLNVWKAIVPTGTVLVTDDFSEADGTLLNGKATDTGQTWTSLGGAPTVSSGHAYSDGATDYLVVPATTPDVAVSATVITYPLLSGLRMFPRITDSSNFIYAEAVINSNGINTFRINKIVAGVVTILFTQTQQTLVSGDVLMCVSAERVVLAYLNGVLQLVVPDTSHLSTAYMGFGMGGATPGATVLDNVQIQAVKSHDIRAAMTAIPAARSTNLGNNTGILFTKPDYSYLVGMRAR